MLSNAIKLFLVLGFILLLWANPGNVTIEVFGYTAMLPLATAILIIAVFFGVLMLVAKALSGIISLKHWVWELFSTEPKTQKIRNLELFIKAVACGSTSNAKKYAKAIENIDSNLAPSTQVLMAEILPEKEKVTAMLPLMSNPSVSRKAISSLIQTPENTSSVVQYYCREHLEKDGFNPEIFIFLVKSYLFYERHQLLFSLAEQYSSKYKLLFICVCYLLAVRAIEQCNYDKASLYISKGLKLDAKNASLNAIGLYNSLLMKDYDSATAFMRKVGQYPFWLVKLYYDKTKNYKSFGCCTKNNLADAYVLYNNAKYKECLSVLKTVEDPFKALLSSLCRIKLGESLNQIESDIAKFNNIPEVIFYDSLCKISISDVHYIYINQPVFYA